MKINVLFSPVNADELYYTHKTTVVIDVLRASSTIVNALTNGAKEIIPVATVEFAVKVSGGMFGGQTLLGGERNTKKIEGFALGNSPLEYTKDKVEDKSIVLFSTNGTKAVVKAKFSENLFVCSFNNLSAMVQHLFNLNENIEILCAGDNNLFSMEDSVCAGMLINGLKSLNKNIELSDSAKAAFTLYDRFGTDIEKLLKNTEHGKLLLKNGFEEDIRFCSNINSSTTIPYFNGTSIKTVKLSETGQAGLNKIRAKK